VAHLSLAAIDRTLSGPYRVTLSATLPRPGRVEFPAGGTLHIPLAAQSKDVSSMPSAATFLWIEHHEKLALGID
jgi:hypothetical protein